MKQVDVRFFKMNPGYGRIFKAILERYRSLGRIGGRVTLNNLTLEEREVISNHLRIDMSNKQQVNFAVRDFEDSLSITRFAEFTLEEILAAYFDTELISKKEEISVLKRERSTFFEALVEHYKNSIAGQWLQAILSKEATGVNKVFQLYEREPQKLLRDIETVAQALHLLEKRKVDFWRLPVFSSLVTADPHAFDPGTDLGKLLVDALCTLFELESPTSGEELAELLYGSGILINEILNFVTCAGLIAYKGDAVHPVWQSALKCNESLQMPLYNLTRLTKVKSPKNVVFVVENPAVFASILDAFSEEKIPPLICTAGQVKISGLILLDFLVAEGTKIYYSGDLDPEGLLIAQRLAKRYSESFNYWRVNEQEYVRYLSAKKLSSTRLAKLKNIDDPKLELLVQRMEITGLATYQELFIPELIKDIRNTLGG